jgi:hypothetical protein
MCKEFVFHSNKENAKLLIADLLEDNYGCKRGTRNNSPNERAK